MATKQTLKNRLYKISRDLLNGIHRDDAWQDLHRVFDNMRENNYDVILEDTKYYDTNGSKGKVYYFSIDNLEHKIQGHITCCFCGSVQDVMECYDMSMVLY